jgi:hypothetical protein
MKNGRSQAQYDIELDTDICDPYTNANLTISLSLGFRQINPAGGANEGTFNDYGDPTATARRIIKWSTGAWANWKKNFVASAQAYWTGKFWLVNEHPLYEFVNKGVSYRPNIFCRFVLKGSDVSVGSHHHTIDVVRLHASESWFGSHSRLYDNRDTDSVEKGRDSAGRPIMQRAHVHEIGHLLGFGHVDEGKAHCPPGGNTNASACYGMADVDKYSVMGQGMVYNASHAMPWRKSIVTLSGRGSVGSATDWAPKLVRHYPRTAAEAAARSAILTKLPRA